MTAAISAAQIWKQMKRDERKNNNSRPVPVIVLEKLDRPGRKILATGNGRCNLSNNFPDLERYHGQNRNFARGALNRMNVDATLDWFSRIGLPCRIENDGRIFPESLQAAAVLDIMRREIQRLSIPIITEYTVARIQKIQKSGHFLISDDWGRTISAQQVIMATGGKAAPAFGCDGSGYELLTCLGHRLTPLYPSLVQVKTKMTWHKGLTGSKFNGRATLYQAGTVLRSEAGEILFTNYGLSGPPILQLSRIIAIKTQNKETGISCCLDFLPHWSEEQLTNWLDQRQQHDPELELADFLVGLIPKKIGRALMKMIVTRPLSAQSVSLTADEKCELVALIKKASLTVTGTLNWEQSQVTAGGIATADFLAATMESKLVPGLYAAGEILDIDGDCGGFNLQWAWSSGFIAGSKAMERALTAGFSGLVEER